MLREYAFNDLAGCVRQRKARSTGLLVGVYNNQQAGLDDDEGKAPWSTVCEEHGHIVSHETLKFALSHAADPGGWCEMCMQIEKSAGQTHDER